MTKKWVNPGFKRINSLGLQQCLYYHAGFSKFTGKPTWLEPIKHRLSMRIVELYNKSLKIQLVKGGETNVRPGKAKNLRGKSSRT
jgi:hypothetical protein